jgi:peptidoglycan-N-acetylmuramic acid deacetylase
MRQLRAALCVLALVLAAGVAGAIAPARATTASPAATTGAGQTAAGARAAGAAWFFIPHGAHVRASIPGSAARLVRRFDALWIGPRRHKVVYLTFDEGWEGGTTRQLLTILERAHVKATFFLTGQWVQANPGLARRIARAGHLVCDHTWSHPRMTALAGRPKAFARQLLATAGAYRRATGERMAHLFRPPYGAYDARVLALARRLGYTTVFWSFAHYDFDLGAQPPVSVTQARIIAAAYPGTVYLLHAASSSNIHALPGAILWLKRHGYGFGTLDGLL